MNKKIWISFSAISFIWTGLIIYLFLWGKLFPFSPIAIGFMKHEFPHTVFYVEKGVEFNDFSRIDALIPEVEDFHEFHFLYKPKLYIFHNDASYRNRSVHGVRFITYYNSNILISPWALQEDKEGKISLEIYMRHELSHSLLFQNEGIWKAWKYPEWLLEGIAVYSANQLGTSWYPSKKETYTLIKQGNFMPPAFYNTRKADSIKLDIPNRVAFIYSEFGCLVDFLIESYGHDKFIQFMKCHCITSDYAMAFMDIYGIDFNTFISCFQKKTASS